MTCYTSGYRAATGQGPANHDPYGWICAEGPSCRHSRKLAPTTRWHPRPEYAVLDNPILARFRDEDAPYTTRVGYTMGGTTLNHVPGTYATFEWGHRPTILEHYLIQLSAPIERDPVLVKISFGEQATLKHALHARRVLTKLAALQAA